MSKVVGLYNYHDGGYCVLDNGKVIEHIEIERYTRLKESGGDSLKYLEDGYLKNTNQKISDIDHWVSPFPVTNLAFNAHDGFDTFVKIHKNDINFYSHHLCHAAHAFYSSNYDDAIIITMDGNGLERHYPVGHGEQYTLNSNAHPGHSLHSISMSFYYGKGKKLSQVCEGLPSSRLSLGAIWGKFTRYVFGLSAGYPRGHQAGSVMAMAALGDPAKYYNDIKNIFVDVDHFKAATQTPAGAKKHVHVPPEDDVRHAYLGLLKDAAQDEQEKFNIAAALQKCTEESIFDILESLFNAVNSAGVNTNNICVAGGVALNSVVMGKIKERFPQIKNIFIPPVPYDGGLSIGACQYHWHHVLENDRNNDFVSPYLGEKYSLQDVKSALNKNNDKLEITKGVEISTCVELITNKNIVSIFNGRSESGRRALGNRSILADPRHADMKDLINKKVKHRQWYRPFAPSILEDHGSEWFENFHPSPYMGFVFKFKKDKLGLAPAVQHIDGSARLQSVNIEQNPIYYSLISEFKKQTGIPIILNTSFNDREPICETPSHAINCFLGTDIDYLYFPEFKILVKKK